MRPAYLLKLVFSYVVKGIKIKITAKFWALRRLGFEDTKRTMSPKMRPKSFGTFEKRAPGVRMIYKWHLQGWNGKYKISKWKQVKVVLLPNKWKQGTFPRCDWLSFFQSWLVLYKKTRAQVPMAKSIEHQECLVDLWYLWTPFSTKWWLFAAKMYYVYGKNISMHLSTYGKNRLIDLSKCWKINHHYAFFKELCELCAQSRIVWFSILA